MPREVAPAVRKSRKTPDALKSLKGFAKSQEKVDPKAWRRAMAVTSYIQGHSSISISEQFDVARASVNRWLQWYDQLGLDGLRTQKREGRLPRLTVEQMNELAQFVEEGPQASGFETGIWTGPMVADFIFRRYGVKYHHQHIPRLLHKLGFSVQRPRKLLARADKEKQAIWLAERLPKIKKKPADAGE